MTNSVHAIVLHPSRCPPWPFCNAFDECAPCVKMRSLWCGRWWEDPKWVAADRRRIRAKFSAQNAGSDASVSSPIASTALLGEGANNG